MTVQNEFLKPCPFCGGQAEILNKINYNTNTYRFFATCMNCGVETPRTARNTQQAADAWNRRTAETATKRY